jgi:hypothetical protein
MAGRSTILISCTREEAEQMHAQARAQSRTLSATVLKVVLRGLEFDDRMFEEFRRARLLPPAPPGRGPKTVVHLRCSSREANWIRAGARRRGATISGYILYFLRSAWMTDRPTDRPTDRERELHLRMQDFSKLQGEIDKSRYDFIVAELDLALTFFRIAQSTASDQKANRDVAHARKAYFSAKRFLKYDSLTHEQKLRINDKLERLASLIAEIE